MAAACGALMFACGDTADGPNERRLSRSRGIAQDTLGATCVAASDRAAAQVAHTRATCIIETWESQKSNRDTSPPAAADVLQRPLVPRFRFQARLSRSVRLL